MSALVTIKGVVTSSKVFKPGKDQNGDPHQRIDILQIYSVDNESGSDTVEIRDFDLTKRYQPGMPIEVDCFVSHFKQYLSYKVCTGKSMDFKLAVAEKKAS